MFAGLSNMGPLSERNDDPSRASRPFDSDRDGFVFGEGAVVMVVESAEHAARARGTGLRREVAGGALTVGRLPHERARAERRLRGRGDRRALERSGIDPEELGYICAHGTGTRANDTSESRAIRDALGDATDTSPSARPSPWSATSSPPPAPSPAWSACSAIRDGVVPPDDQPHNPGPRVRPRPRRPHRPRGPTPPPPSPTPSASAARTASSPSAATSPTRGSSGGSETTNLAIAPSGLERDPLDERRDRHLERPRKSNQSFEQRLPLSRLEQTDLGAMDPRPFRKALLAQPSGLPHPQEIPPEPLQNIHAPRLSASYLRATAYEHTFPLRR